MLRVGHDLGLHVYLLLIGSLDKSRSIHPMVVKVCAGTVKRQR